VIIGACNRSLLGESVGSTHRLTEDKLEGNVDEFMLGGIDGVLVDCFIAKKIAKKNMLNEIYLKNS